MKIVANRPAVNEPRNHSFRPRTSMAACPLRLPLAAYLRSLGYLLSLLFITLNSTWAYAESDQSMPAESESFDALDAEMGALDDIELFELDMPEVVFAAGRREQTVESLPYAISVITAEDIRRSGALTVPDALRLVAGSNVAQASAMTPAVSLRGFTGLLSRDLLVLVDGRQIFDGLYGGTVWGAWPFQIEDIERIEAIHGPAGLTWGPNAVNGVINIITKAPSDQPQLVLRAGAGTQGWNRDYLGYSFSDKRLSFKISGEYERGDGHVRGGNFLFPIDNDYRTGRINLKGAYEIDEQYTLRFAGGSAIVGGAYLGSPLFEDSQQGRSRASYIQFELERRQSSDDLLTLSLYANDFGILFGTGVSDYGYDQIGLSLTQVVKPSDAHTLTWGIDTRLDYFDAGSADGLVRKAYITSGLVGIFIQDEWQLDERWILNIGGRIDYSAYSGFEPSARVGATYKLNEQHALFGAVSRAVHMPPAPYHFVEIPVLGGLSGIRSVSLLENQPVMAYEIGYRGHLLDEKLDLTANLYWHEFRDVTAQIYQPLAPFLITRVVDSSAAVSTYGFELESDYRPVEDWRFLANYTYQQLDWHPYTTSPQSHDILSSPQHQFMLGVQHDLTEDLHLSAHWYFVDDVKSPSPLNIISGRSISDYHRLDLTGSYEFWEDRASLTVGVKNLLDNHHPEGGSVTTNESEVPRMIFAELRLSVP